MHFEILVEDQSGKQMLEILVPKILGDTDAHTFAIHAYKGIGRIPQNLASTTNPGQRILLDRLPQLLRGYGKAWIGYKAVVVVVCDLDDRCLKAFKQELTGLCDACHPCPQTRFCIAIEEGEAWLLGDIAAVKKAYPKVKEDVLNKYVQDSICGTWERLADAVYAGGSAALSACGWQAVGAQKFQWAKEISPYMDVGKNASPSFMYFHKSLLDLMEAQPSAN